MWPDEILTGFEPDTTPDMPPKLRDIIADGWTFPTDYPVVNNATTPDASRTLKAVIEHSITEYYSNYRINTFVLDDFTKSLSARLYKTMPQHQFWIDQFLNLIDDNQFFYNDETQNLSQSSSALSKTSDTPQNTVSDINNYLSSAEQASGTTTNTNTFHKSTLGDITVQFRNFAGFPNFIDTIIEAVNPCFINFHGNEDIDYGTAQ